MIAQRAIHRFARRLVTALSVFSLLLSLATVTLWVRSGFFQDLWMSSRTNNRGPYTRRILELSSDRGALDFRAVTAETGYFGTSHIVVIQNSADRYSQTFNFKFVREGEDVLTSVPHWSLALLFALLPTYSAISYFRHRKQRLPGHCRSCGYDLRATPERCPECGKEKDEL